jgi:uncharacterized membrane protein SirB2
MRLLAALLRRGRAELAAKHARRAIVHNAVMLSSHYPAIHLLHVGCVALSGALFTARGLMRIADLASANHRALRWTSYVVDTGLLGAAIALTLIVHQYPFVSGWLTTKVLLLPLYIALGIIALKRARTRFGRSAAFLAAILTFIYMVGVARAHDPAGWFVLLR